MDSGKGVAMVLTDNVWLGPLLWATLYVSDYVLTIMCARLYRAQDKIVFEGSYEITPMFQADVDALRHVSPRFLGLLALSTGYLFLVRALVGPPSSGLFGFYSLVLGAMLLVQATVHMRHLRNWYLFRRGIALLKGRLEHPRAHILRSSAFELAAFATLYAGLFLVTQSLFVLGGALGCALVSMSHYRLARRHDAVVSRAP